MHPLRLLLGLMPQLLVEFGTLSGTGGAAAILSLAGGQPRRGDRPPTGRIGRPVPALSLPYHYELRPDLPERPEPGACHCRNQAADGEEEVLADLAAAALRCISHHSRSPPQ